MTEETDTQKPNSEAVDPASAGSHLRWHKLSSISIGDVLTELMAATCENGIGVIVTWTRKDEGWEVFAMDTEGSGWERVFFFGPDDSIPATPPTEFDDVN